MLRFSLFALAALTAACATPAEQVSAGDSDCFRAGSVNGYSVIDRNNVEVRVSPSRRYVLHTDWDTYNLRSAQGIAVRSPTGSICTGETQGILLETGGQTYPVQSVSRAPEPATQG